MNALFVGAVEMRTVERGVAIKEIKELLRWQEKRKRWHQDKTRQKMATASDGPDGVGIEQSGAGGLANTFKASDFGLNALDLQDLNDDEEEEGGAWGSSSEDEDEDADPIVAERKRRQKRQDLLRRSAGEPVKPSIVEVRKMKDGFLSMLRMVLAE